MSRAAAARGGRAQDLWLDGLARPVRLRDAAEVFEAFAAASAGWTVSRARPADGRAPLAAIERRRGGFHLRSRWLDRPLTGLSLPAAMTALAADIAEELCTARPGGCGLHVGAVRFPAGLVLLAGAGGAGKSALVARLCAEPIAPPFGDDVVALRPDGRAEAIGVAPRLRLPLPPSEALRRIVAEACVASDGRYAFLSGALVAPRGASAAPVALVRLERRAGAAPRLGALDASATLATLAARAILPPDPAAAPAVFDAVARTAQALAGYSLAYDDLDAAAALLVVAFGGTGLPQADAGPPAPAPRPAEPAAPEALWRRAPYVAVRRQGDGLALWDLGEGTLYRLDGVGAALWDLLDRPWRGAELAALMAEAFPDAEAGAVRRDVLACLGALADAELVEPAGPKPSGRRTGARPPRALASDIHYVSDT